MINDRLSTHFHEKFSLSRQAIYQIIKTVDNYPNISKMSKKERVDLFQSQTSLGPNYIRSMPQYASGSGLLTFTNALTKFGQCALRYDPLFDQVGTQWLMHYHLSAPHGPGAPFWHELISKRFYRGSTFFKEDIVNDIGNFIWETDKKILATEGVKSTATIFLGTYTKPEGLEKLNFLPEPKNERYSLKEPAQIPVWAFGYALLDYWSAYYPDRISVGLDTLQEGDFAKIFMIGKTELDNMLQALQEAHYVEVQRSAPPHQIYLLRPDGEPLLEKLYGAD